MLPRKQASMADWAREWAYPCGKASHPASGQRDKGISQSYHTLLETLIYVGSCFRIGGILVDGF